MKSSLFNYEKIKVLVALNRFIKVNVININEL